MQLNKGDYPGNSYVVFLPNKQRYLKIKKSAWIIFYNASSHSCFRFLFPEAEVEPTAEDKNPMTGEGGRNSASCKRGGQEEVAAIG